MRWKPLGKYERQHQWHKWFAWRPVWPMGAKYAYWLETVERRRHVQGGQGCWQYRRPETVCDEEEEESRWSLAERAGLTIRYKRPTEEQLEAVIRIVKETHSP